MQQIYNIKLNCIGNFNSSDRIVAHFFTKSNRLLRDIIILKSATRQI